MNTDIAQVDSIKTLVERVVRLGQVGQLRLAESICRDSLQVYQDDGNLLCMLGTLLIRQGRANEAVPPLRRAVEQYPDFTRAHEELGNALIAQGELGEAINCFQQVTGLDPDNAQAHLTLSKLLKQSGSMQEAAAVHAIACQINPDVEATANANELIAEGRFAEAEKICHELYLRDSENPDLLHKLGRLAMAQKHYRDAAILLRRAAAIAPDSVAILNDLGKVLLEREAYDDAIETIARSIEVDSTIAATYLLYGNALTKAFRYNDAASAYQTGLENDESHPGCLAGIGHVMQALGRHDAAIEAYRRWISGDPTAGEAWWNLSGLSGYEFADVEIQTMQTQLDDNELSEKSRINFLFALARTFDRRGEYAKAFEYYRSGNLAQRPHEQFDVVETEVMHERIVATFRPELLDRKRCVDSLQATPIFIVGMPRSGSTLIEQILASHSQVDGTQELPALGRVIESINRQANAGNTYPEAVLELDDSRLAELARQYLDFTSRYRSDRPFFTDKMLNNFPGVGLIHLLCPNAVIIDASRNPLDCCLGCYQQLFSQGQAFTYDLVELGEYYLQYRKMMDYWQHVLPNRVLELEYENLVADPERQVQRLLNHCGLPWEDQCMRFYDTDRIINTASAEQVRRPIYRSAVNRWQNYENQLNDLIELLKPGLQQLPEDQRPAPLSR